MSQRRKLKTKSKEISKSYEPSPQERGVCRAKPRDGRFAAPEGLRKGGVNYIEPDHQDVAIGSLLLMNALGTTEPAFLNFCWGRSLTPERKAAKSMSAVSTSCLLEPKDQVEAMLGAQMAAVHMATMTFARRLAHVENIPQQDSAERAFNKLARTFAMQMEALKRYRMGGQQKVTVEHVTVHDGGQAIVGSVGIGEGQRKNKEATS